MTAEPSPIEQATAHRRETATLSELFAGFFSVGLIGFGGVMPWIRRMTVDQRKWLTPAEFTDMLALCQFLPGPNVTNLAICLGARERGAAGSAAAAAGLLAAPLVIIVALGAVYDRIARYPVVADGLSGLACAAAGLVLATALRIAQPIAGRRLGVGIAAVTFVCVAIAKVPLVPALLVLAPVSVLLHARIVR